MAASVPGSKSYSRVSQKRRNPCRPPRRHQQSRRPQAGRLITARAAMASDVATVDESIPASRAAQTVVSAAVTATADAPRAAAGAMGAMGAIVMVVTVTDVIATGASTTGITSNVNAIGMS